MALHLAGQEYEDIRVTGESWAELKQSGKPLFGQVPMLELDDGTCLVQTSAILNYIGATYNLRGSDPLHCAFGEMATEYLWNDFFMKGLPQAIWAKEDREAKLKAWSDEHWGKFVANIEKTFRGKFIVGDSVTIYDC